MTIARALVNDPAIVWADEPTGDLDSENAAEISQLMRRLNLERGLTFLIVTHDPSVGASADRIVRMVDGQVVSDEYLTEAGRSDAGRDGSEVDDGRAVRHPDGIARRGPRRRARAGRRRRRRPRAAQPRLLQARHPQRQPAARAHGADRRSG